MTKAHIKMKTNIAMLEYEDIAVAGQSVLYLPSFSFLKKEQRDVMIIRRHDDVLKPLTKKTEANDISTEFFVILIGYRQILTNGHIAQSDRSILLKIPTFLSEFDCNSPRSIMWRTQSAMHQSGFG